MNPHDNNYLQFASTLVDIQYCLSIVVEFQFHFTTIEYLLYLRHRRYRSWYIVPVLPKLDIVHHYLFVLTISGLLE